MRLSFDSIDEVKEFVEQLKGTRTTKGKKEDGEATTGNVPAPMQPPAATVGFNPAGNMGSAFAAPAPGAAPAAMAFPAVAATGPAPEVLALVTRIFAKLEGAVAAGAANPDQALQWFRGECIKAGQADAGQATLDQIKTIVMPRLPVPVLESIAKQMNA